MATERNNLLIDTHHKLREGANTSVQSSVTYLHLLTGIFKDHFEGIGYDTEQPVGITEHLDSTVRFIGAPISVLKPYFMDGIIPTKGILMVQNCIRTQNVKSLFDITLCPKYGSFFTGMCVLASYDRLRILCEETCSMLYEKLGLTEGEVCVNINSEDEDLMNAVRGLLPSSMVNLNTKPHEYYRHKYGIEGVRGRNFNFAIRNVSTDEFVDIGNVIVIESGKEKLGIELALGDTTIMQQLLGLGHVQDSYNLELPTFLPSEALKRKLEDAIITCLALFREGLRQNASSTQARTLRSYVKALSLYRRLCRISLDDLGCLLEDAQDTKLPFESHDSWREIIGCVEDCEWNLSNTQISLEDIKIAKILNSATTVMIKEPQL